MLGQPRHPSLHSCSVRGKTSYQIKCMVLSKSQLITGNMSTKGRCAEYRAPHMLSRIDDDDLKPHHPDHPMRRLAAPLQQSTFLTPSVGFADYIQNIFSVQMRRSTAYGAALHAPHPTCPTQLAAQSFCPWTCFTAQHNLRGHALAFLRKLQQRRFCTDKLPQQ